MRRDDNEGELKGLFIGFLSAKTVVGIWPYLIIEAPLSFSLIFCFILLLSLSPIQAILATPWDLHYHHESADNHITSCGLCPFMIVGRN